MYKLYHGDCLEVLPTLAPQSIDAVIADIPYGTTACKWDVIIPFDQMWKNLVRIIKPKRAIVLFSNQPFTSLLVSSNVSWFRDEWIWVKEQGTGNLNANKKPLKKHENIIVFCKHLPLYNPQMTDGKAYSIKREKNKNEIFGKTGTRDGYITNNVGLRYPVSILEYKRELKNRHHPTQKPVALMEYLIKTYTNEGDTVLDFTMGSGSTGVAALNTNRNFIGIELDAQYFSIAQERISNV